MATDLQLEALAQKLYPYLAADFLSLRSGFEANTWTPTYFGSATAGTTTYTAQQGAYVRIGRLVAFTLTLAWTAATGTGQVRIGLAHTTANVSNQNFAATVYSQSVTFANSGIDGIIQPNTNFVRLFSPLTNALNTELNIEAAGTLVLSGWYLIP